MGRLAVRGNLIVDREVREDWILSCEDGVIVHAGPWRGEAVDVRVTGGYVAPGYVDVHVHGAGGCDVMDASETALARIAQTLAAHGVTGFLATTLTAGLRSLTEVLRTCRVFALRPSPGAALLGVHLEGPWIAPEYKGAQNPAFIADPTVADARVLLWAAGGWLRIVTLAPERPGAREVIAYLRSRGVRVSAGHTSATWAEMKAAAGWGVSQVTHCFNAMRGFHHREPGVVGAAMMQGEWAVELIADGIHVHPGAMGLLYRVKGADHILLVSDAMRAAGMPDGDYNLGGLAVTVRDGAARLPDGTLAGSTLMLDRAVQNMVRLCGVPVGEAVTMASEVPARAAGYGHRKGRLAVGYDADFVVLDRNLRVQQTFIAGVERWPVGR
ncbi:MAG: N-acetylglucosamine-6-phosphate deacetylase [Kyrpidia tusciae]|nr:N-acetylglucosamine-6-phosphate deacetylase [Kyrpidia tusciae]MBE3551471.1 N-acetylglucosamine-6-phosphate deacetylase [Kyrpidia tusciae]